MSKHSTITKNLLALTGRRSLDNALAGWEIKNLIHETVGKKYSVCELCGTHFLQGAVMYHPLKNQTISVGGTCLGTILDKSFPDRTGYRLSKSQTQDELIKRYGNVVDPGNWIKWMRVNSPPSLAQPLAILEYFGGVSSKDLNKLVRFHDGKRLYPRHALIPDWRIYSKFVPISEHMTISESKRILKLVSSKGKEPSVISGRSRAYFREELKPILDEYLGLQETWDRLNSVERRCLLALCRLSELRKNPAHGICETSLANSFRPLDTTHRRTEFLWNPKGGVGIVYEDDWESGDSADIWFWHTRDFGERRYRLTFFRQFQPDSQEVTVKLEQLAFSRRLLE